MQKSYRNISADAMALLAKQSPNNQYWLRLSADYLAMQYRSYERRENNDPKDFTVLMPSIGEELDALMQVSEKMVKVRQSLMGSPDSEHLWQEINCTLVSAITIRQNVFACLMKQKEDGLCRH